MYNWKDTRNYRRFRDENGNVIANIIYVDGEEVAVSDEVYEAYASMDRRERYLEERDNDDKPLSVDALLEEGYLQHDMLQRKHLTHFDCWASTFGETATAIELAPEGTGYRARTRFSKFFNLPELMQLFKEAADIKTADQLHLPTPTPIYHNVVAQPTEIQKGMVQELSERAAKVHAGIVDASTDNMLKITSDGRKLGLDQRVINPDLPDEAGSKVNLCVDNIYSVWKDGQADKLTQLVFCDRVAIRCYK